MSDAAVANAPPTQRPGTTTVGIAHGSDAVEISRSDPLVFSLQLGRERLHRLFEQPPGTPVLTRTVAPLGAVRERTDVRVDQSTVLTRDGGEGPWREYRVTGTSGVRRPLSQATATGATPETYVTTPQRAAEHVEMQADAFTARLLRSISPAPQTAGPWARGCL